ncbi:MAG: TetR/AcrR family transcriptional regulator, partial [Alphaproteobacteria bacterium]
MARPQAADYEDRKQEIVNRAAELFASHSFLGTSINDIAAACGFSKSLLYHYFKSKEELLAAVMHSHIDRLEGQLEKAETAGESSSEVL